MGNPIFAYIAHQQGAIDDSASELAQAAAKIDPAAEATAIVAGSGADLKAACDQAAKVYKTVWMLDNEACAYPNAEVIRRALVTILPENATLLVSHGTFGMDLSPGLAVKLNAAFVSDVVAVEDSTSEQLTVVRQEFGGQVSSHMTVDTQNGAVVNIRPGVFTPTETETSGAIEDKSDQLGDLTAGRRFLEVVEAEMGDVDITKEDVLVSVGRGIEDEDNLEIAQDLAEAMGAAVSCSRPIVDAKWLEKSRQVGTSGQTVSPKVYLACGISGSFQHMGGLKGNPFIVAINKNAKAPIFQMADVGIVTDILDFLPELTDSINDL